MSLFFSHALLYFNKISYMIFKFTETGEQNQDGD